MLSPTIGHPIAAPCTRSWCVRPVTGVSASQVIDPDVMDPDVIDPDVIDPDRPSTFQVVTDGKPLGSGFIHQPRLSSRRPSASSMVPSSRFGPPSTTAQ